MASVYPARRKWLFNHIQSYIARQAADGLIRVCVRPPRGLSSGLPIFFRAGNRADYQTLWECLGDEIYPVPVGLEVRHILDGGANLGLFSIWHSNLPALRDVVLVEPDPKNLELLRRNVDADRQFTIIPAALSGSDGEAFFESAEANTGHLAGVPGHAPTAMGFTVACKRLAGLFPSNWSMEHTWLKLDIEGAEYEVIDNLLAGEHRPAAISMEIHDYLKADGARLVAQLERAGYSVSMLEALDVKNTCRQITAVLSADAASRLVGSVL
jgi:FkbM family methyltransferase